MTPNCNYYNDLDYGYYGYYSGFGRFARGGLGHRTSVSTFTEGTLVVDVFGNRHKEPIWHGSASKRLSRDYAAPELIDEAVMTLLQQFPDRDAMRKIVQDEVS